MKRMTLVFAIALIALTGCATGPKFTDMGSPPDGRGYVVIYRAPAFASGAWAISFWLDGRRFADVHNSGYSYVSVKPGTHKLHVNSKEAMPTNTITVDVKSGQRTYVRFVNALASIQAAGPGFLAVSGWTIEAVPETRAMAELPEYKFTAPLVASID